MSGSVLRSFSLDVHPTSIALADGLVWVAAYSSGTVEGIDPRTGQAVGTVNVGNGPSAICFGDGDLWVANSLDSTVSVVDPATFTVLSTIAVGSGPAALVAATAPYGWPTSTRGQSHGSAPSAWPSSAPSTSATTRSRWPQGQAVVWVAASAPAGDDRGGTLVLVSTPGFTRSTRPCSTADGTVEFPAPGLRHVGHLRAGARPRRPKAGTRPRAPGPGAHRRGPHLQFPAPPRHPLLQRRPGQGERFPLRVERLFALGSPGASFYSGLVGAGACQAHPGNCDLSQGVVTERRRPAWLSSISAPPTPTSSKSSPRMPTAAPVPPGTPDRDMGLTPVPGTGPYRITRATPREVVFERNPYFREWSHAAQPEGNPD